jgi:hypothetical protein
MMNKHNRDRADNRRITQTLRFASLPRFHRCFAKHLYSTCGRMSHMYFFILCATTENCRAVIQQERSIRLIWRDTSVAYIETGGASIAIIRRTLYSQMSCFDIGCRFVKVSRSISIYILHTPLP